MNESNSDSEEEFTIPLHALPDAHLPHFYVDYKSPKIVNITCIRSPSCIYLQLKDKESYLLQFLKNMIEHYTNNNQTPLSSINELPLHSHWCVSINGEWLRGKVVANVPHQKDYRTDERQFKILLVDYGVIKFVSLKDIFHLEEQFTFDPPFALECTLSQVFLLDSETMDWSEEAVNFCNEVVKKTDECVAIFLPYKEAEQVNKPYEVILELQDGTVLNEELVKRGLAQSKIINIFINDDELNKSQEPIVVANESGDDREEAYGNDLDCFDPMAEDFYSPHNTFHRSDECAETALMGFKNEEELLLCKFFSKNKPCPRGELCKWKHIIPREDGLPSGVEDIYYKLENEVTLPEEGSLEKVKITSILSPGHFFIYRPSRGYDNNVDLLVELQNDLSEAYGFNPNAFLPKCMPSVGELMVLCKGTGSSKQFYRVRVIVTRHDDEKENVEVFYIDYGHVEKVDECQLKKLSPQFLNPPAQAIECFIDDVHPTGGNWQEAATTYFKESLEGSLITVMFTQIEYDQRCGLLIFHPNHDGKTVNEELCERGYGYMPC